MTEKERLEKIMETEGMNARQFATEIGVQSSTISNIMGDRNRPSLEVLQKVLNRFRTISSDWLILGVGSMYRQKIDSQQPTLFEEKPLEQGGSYLPLTQPVEIPAPSNANKRVLPEPVVQTKLIAKKVQKVVIFYEDGTFEEIIK
ncbi:MAG: helix-turn-helix domain-containing protein [Paludibacteraceae bacterium]